MKLINLIIGKMFESELTEIGKMIQEDIDKEREYLQNRFVYVDDAERFLEIKERIKKLDNFSCQLKPENILDVDFYSSDNPIFILPYERKVKEIIDNALSIPKVVTISNSIEVDKASGEETIRTVIDGLKRLGVNIN